MSTTTTPLIPMPRVSRARSKCRICGVTGHNAGNKRFHPPPSNPPPRQVSSRPPVSSPIETEDCPICMESLGKTNCCTTACGHQFCMKCFLKHTKTKDTCPICRSHISGATPVARPLRRQPGSIDITIENVTDQTIHLYWLPFTRPQIRLLTIRPFSSRQQRVGNRGDRFSIVVYGSPNTHTFTANNSGENFIFTGDSVIPYN